jgi:hypothetical protein
MNIQTEIISQASPKRVASLFRSLIMAECSKGCTSDISSYPVHLAPVYQSLSNLREMGRTKSQPIWAQLPVEDLNSFHRYKIMITPNNEYKTIKSERFLKQLQGIQNRCCFEIMGNNKEFYISFICHEMDFEIIRISMAAEIKDCILLEEISPADTVLKIQDFGDFCFYEFHPFPSYHHLLTTNSELEGSGIESLLIAVSNVEPPGIVCYQVILEPANYAWGNNIKLLCDLEYSEKLIKNMDPSQKSIIQHPTSDLHSSAAEANSKANLFKPFYFVSIRFAAFGSGQKNNSLINDSTGFMHLFHHGGKPLNKVCKSDYLKRNISTEELKAMFINAYSYRLGFIVNSLELSTILNIPSLRAIKDQKNIKGIITTDLQSPEIIDTQGLDLGICSYGGKKRNLIIPDSLRNSHCRIIGGTGSGKSTLIENSILQDIHHKRGLIFLDPHGDSVNRILCQVPEEAIPRIAYIKLGDPYQIIIWNPSETEQGQDIGRKADSFLSSILSFVDKNATGDRMEFILWYMLHALSTVPNTTMLDLLKLLHRPIRNKSGKIINNPLYNAILSHEKDPSILQFWKKDYKNYREEEFGPPRHKIGKLFFSESLSLSFSQPENKISFKDFMDNNKIVLVDLSLLGPMIKSTAGCFLISELYSTALLRSSIEENNRIPFNVYIDEAHQYLPLKLDQALTELRKFKVGITLSSQFISQFDHVKNEALAGVGSTIIFRVGSKDAHYLAQQLKGQFKADDLINIDNYESIGRFKNDVVKFQTHSPKPVPDNHFRDRIIQESYKRYYKPVHEVKAGLSYKEETYVNPPYSGMKELFIYDEF